jgi:adenosylcobinamide-phosphate synthase
MFVLLTFLAMVAELAFGYPDRIYRRIGHPVTWIGRLIAAMDRRWNQPNLPAGRRRAAGVGALIVLLAMAGGAGALIHWWLGAGWGLLLVALAASSLIAQRSLYAHVAAVAQALESEGIESGRRAVSMIVGRDPESLDEAGVARAAIESLSENFSDGVVAPVFWLAVGGLGGGAAYKAVNTADSMIGHRTPRHEAFGWAAACFDDLVNLPASRLSAILIVLGGMAVSGASPREALGAARRDACRHRSPNAGWTEAAMAGALGLALAGQRRYGGVAVDDATMNEGGRREATAADIRQALAIYRVADGLLVALLGLVAFMVHG